MAFLQSALGHASRLLLLENIHLYSKSPAGMGGGVGCGSGGGEISSHPGMPARMGT